jgi:hypothetical protein
VASLPALAKIKNLPAAEKEALKDLLKEAIREKEAEDAAAAAAPASSRPPLGFSIVHRWSTRDGSRAHARSGEPHSGSAITGVFMVRVLWNALSDLLGSGAAAAIIGRALHRATPLHPELAGFVIARVDLEYGYELPREFDQPASTSSALAGLLKELRPLLIELTGPVALRSLARIPELRDWATPDP